jgi:hypothetical protein
MSAKPLRRQHGPTAGVEPEAFLRMPRRMESRSEDKLASAACACRNATLHHSHASGAAPRAEMRSQRQRPTFRAREPSPQRLQATDQQPSFGVQRASNVRVERRLEASAAGCKVSARTRGWAPGSGSQHDLSTTRPLPLGLARTLPATRLPGNHAFVGQTHRLSTAAGGLARNHRPSVACGPLNAANGRCPEGTGEPRK